LKKPLTVAWISDFPVEWLPDLPEPLRALPRRHPATWQIALLSEFEKDPSLHVHLVMLRRRIERSLSFNRNGTVFHVLKAPAWLRLASLFWADTLLIKRLCQQIKPDLVHAWGTEKGAALIASRLDFPYVMTVQGLFCWYKERVPLAPYDRFVERLERISLPRAPVVTTESSFAVQYLKKRYPNMRVQQAEHVPNRAFLEVQRRPEVDPLHFVSVGSLGFRKGTDLLFRALDQLGSELSFRVTMITDPDPRCLASLKPLLSAALWPRVEMRYQILPHEVAKALEPATIMLLPTRADTSPNAVKEAVVAGLPVVASNVGGIPDYVFDGQNGLLFPPDDLPGFVRALRAACVHPLFSKGAVEPAALARARAYLSPQLMAANFLKAYDAALTAGAS
jgi:glycosyltransferase involved in cell wall biosynthesis